MHIATATFVKSIVDADELLEDGKPQIAFIGRSNSGKSSLINSLTRQKDLAKTSSFPGRTQQLNVFLINKAVYLIDLPGYGYAKTSHESRERLHALIHWYFFESEYEQKKVVFIIDAFVGPTDNDLEMFQSLEGQGKDIIVVANKVDKIKKSKYDEQLKYIQEIFGNHTIIPYSSDKKIGISVLTDAILAK